MRKIRMLICGLLFLTGCTGYESGVQMEGVDYYIDTSGKRAFAGECRWQYSDQPSDITVHETAEGARVTRLGGFFGTGVPSPFQITADRDTYRFSGEEIYASDYGLPVVSATVPVTIHLPETVEEIKYVHPSLYYGDLSQDGVIAFYRPYLRVDCDPDNPYFYSTDGVLYQKEDNTVIDLNTEADFDASVHYTLRDKLLGRYVLETEEGQQVYEFFDAFGTVYAHISWYMDGAEYMFSAMEFTPENEADLQDEENESFAASLREFSDFSMAGQYVDPEESEYQITVSEDSAVLTTGNKTLELMRDNRLPSQYPFSSDEMHMELPADMVPMPFTHYKADGLLSERLACDAYDMKLYQDGTLLVVLKHSEAPVIYRGMAQLVSKRNADQLMLRYALTKTGGSREPLEGLVQLTFNEDATITFSEAADCEGGVLLQERTEVTVSKENGTARTG